MQDESSNTLFNKNADLEVITHFHGLDQINSKALEEEEEVSSADCPPSNGLGRKFSDVLLGSSPIYAELDFNYPIQCQLHHPSSETVYCELEWVRTNCLDLTSTKSISQYSISNEGCSIIL